MANLQDYLSWRGDLSLKQVPFNKVDALLFALISYNIFDGLVSEDFKKSVRMDELLAVFKTSPDFEERKDIGAMINEHTFDIFEQTVNCVRFKDLKVCGYKSVIDLNKAEQFAAITFSYGKTNVIVYRGTDDSIVGWKEDFNISWQDSIPSQNDALEYFEKAASTLKGNFIMIGHSKGGNLVMNTASKCSPKLQKRLDTIYNFDGPGFTKDFYCQKGFLNVKDRLKSFYPGFSIVGMIFYHPEDFEIVQCDGFALYQHDPFMWQICGGDFIYAKDFTSESKFFYTSFNDWADKMTKEQRKELVTTLFDIIEASDCKSNKELVKNRLKASAKMIDAYTKLNHETKSEIHKIVRVLHQAMHDSLPLLSFINVQK